MRVGYGERGPPVCCYTEFPLHLFRNMLRTLDKEQLNLVIYLLSLVEKIASHYELKNGIEVGIRGVVRGLKAYRDSERWDLKLDVYLTWWIKTAIEAEMGVDNKDTKAYLSQKH